MQKMETYYGQVRTPADAIKLFEACRLGMLPRVQRRLSEKERQAIRSGSVFVWDEREAGMRRWTDGKSWSASRVSGSFLTYREMEGKRGSGFGGGRRGAGKTPDSGRGSDEDHEDGEPEGYRYKADGLLKQSFSITTSNGQHLHLISYYSRPHSGQPELLQPTTDPNLRHITPQKGLYPESSLHDSNPTPALTRTPMAHHPAYTISQPPAQVPAYASYHPQYAQQSPGYTWPPSPVATPPYSQHQTPGYPPTTMPPHVAHTAPPPHHTMYHPAPPPQHPYERAPLPPPAAQSRALPPYPQAHSPHMSHSHAAGSPRGHHAHTLSAPFPSPQLPQLDPNLRRGSPPTSRGPLPTLMPIAPPQGSTSPARTHSVSPPRSSHSDTNTAVNSNKTSISSLLHATPSNSEPSSANPASNTSAASSPRTMTRGGPLPPLPDRSGVFSEDVRTRELLDRKFCI